MPTVMATDPFPHTTCQIITISTAVLAEHRTIYHIMFPYVFATSYQVFQTVSYSCALIIVALCLCKCRDYNEEIYTVETDYLKWVTNLPAFTVCPAVSGRYIKQQMEKITRNVSPQEVLFYGNLLRPKRTLCPGCPLGKVFEENVTKLVEKFTPACEKQLIECSWNDLPFPCCQYFQEMPTKQGMCYTMNSEQTIGNPSKQPISLVTSFARPRADIKIKGQQSFSLYIHERKAINLPKPRITASPGKTAKILYRFTEIVASESAKQLHQTQRRCELGQEGEGGWRKYHHSVCKSNCLVKKQMEECGCRHHLLKGEGDECKLSSLMCLDEKARNVSKTECGCKRACTGQEVKIVHVSMKGNNNKFATAEISLTKPPTERDIYYAKTTILDTLVGFVCLTRLITTVSLYDAIIALIVLLQNYMDAINFLRFKTISLLRVKNY